MSVEKLRRIAAATHIRDGEAVGIIMRDLREALREFDAELSQAGREADAARRQRDGLEHAVRNAPGVDEYGTGLTADEMRDLGMGEMCPCSHAACVGARRDAEGVGT